MLFHLITIYSRYCLLNQQNIGMQRETRVSLEDLRKSVGMKREVDILEANKLGKSLQVGWCLHPVTKERIPLFVADYVLDDYGTGSVMGVPAHDGRDRSIAEKHRIEFSEVVDSNTGLLKNSGADNDGMSPQQFKERVEMRYPFVKKHKTFQLRDWLISRQRYWGVPIPVVHCAECGVVPVEYDSLPVKLPHPIDEDSFKEKVKNNSIISLLQSNTFRDYKCGKCKSTAKREIDTMDTFVDSSWYFLRFLDPFNDSEVEKP